MKNDGVFFFRIHLRLDKTHSGYTRPVVAGEESGSHHAIAREIVDVKGTYLLKHHLGLRTVQVPLVFIRNHKTQGESQRVGNSDIVIETLHLHTGSKFAGLYSHRIRQQLIMLAFHRIALLVNNLNSKRTVVVNSPGSRYRDIEHIIVRFPHRTLVQRVGKHQVIGSAINNPLLLTSRQDRHCGKSRHKSCKYLFHNSPPYLLLSFGSICEPGASISC